jgi:hypothetical protein
MILNLSRDAAYELRDMLNKVLVVDEESPLKLYRVRIGCSPAHKDATVDEFNLTPEFCDMQSERSSESS